MRVSKTKPVARALDASGLLPGALGLLAVPMKSQSGSQHMEATIRADRNVTTLVNILNVEPDNQEALVAALKEGIEAFFSKMPGFISSCVLTGENDRQVISYSQWRSDRAIDAFRQHPSFKPYIQPIAALLKGEAISITCGVAFVHAS